MGKDIKNLEGIEIILGYKCNYNCFFCFEQKLKSVNNDKKKSEVISLIKKGFINGGKFIIFSGGEPTLYNDLFFYIDLAKKIGYEKIILHTNGSNTANLNYFIELYNLGLTGVIFSIHGYGKISNLITGNSFSFEYLNNSLINASIIKNKNNNFSIDTNTVINKINIKNILILLKYLRKFPVTRRMITLPYSMFLFKNDDKKIVFPNISVVVDEIKKILDFVILNKINDVVIEAIPYCFFEKKYWPYIEKNYRTNKNVFLPDSFFIKNMTNEEHYKIGKIKLSNCSNCIKNNSCLGLSEDYYSLYKNTKLNPIYS